MRVRVYTADTGGCGWYRLIFPARVLQAEGYDVECVTHEDEGADSFTTLKEDVPHTLTMSDGSVQEVLLPKVRGVVKPDCDVVVLQRPLRRELVECIPYLQEHGVAVVVELDDDFEKIPPRNVAWKQTHPGNSPERNHRWLRLACEMADLVTCSTPALAASYSGYLLPNLVPESYFKIEGEKDADGPPVIGWTGNVQNHPDDLQESGNAVRRLLANKEARIAVVGDGMWVAYSLGLAQGTVVPASGFVPINHYPGYMAQFDLGIVPLQLNAFNEAKSWLKGLEFAALGVPFVASPTREYRALAARGAGVTARGPKGWYGLLRHWAIDADARQAAGAAARDAVREMTYENHADRWWMAWQIAAGKRKVGRHV